MKTPFNLLIVGVGGQGIVLASDIAALAAMNAGLDVKKSEIHGMSQRGGSVFSHIRFGEKVHSPVIPEGGADILVSLEEMEILRWLRYASKKTTVILPEKRILPSNAKEYPEGTVDYIRNNFPKRLILGEETLKAAAGKPKFSNSVILGILSNHTPLSEDNFTRAIKELSPEGTAPENLKAFAAGRQILLK